MHTNGRYLNCECVCCPSVGKQIISVILDEMLMFSTTWTAYWNNLFHKHEEPPSPGQNRSSSSSITMRHILIHCVLKSFFSFVLLSFGQCIITHTHTKHMRSVFNELSRVEYRNVNVFFIQVFSVCWNRQVICCFYFFQNMGNSGLLFSVCLPPMCVSCPGLYGILQLSTMVNCDIIASRCVLNRFLFWEIGYLTEVHFNVRWDKQRCTCGR